MIVRLLGWSDRPIVWVCCCCCCCWRRRRLGHSEYRQSRNGQNGRLVRWEHDPRMNGLWCWRSWLYWWLLSRLLLLLRLLCDRLWLLWRLWLLLLLWLLCDGLRCELLLLLSESVEERIGNVVELEVSAIFIGVRRIDIPCLHKTL